MKKLIFLFLIFLSISTLVYAIDFDGTDDYIDIAHDADYNFDDDEPHSGYAVISFTSTSQRNILSKIDPDGSYRGWQFYVDGGKISYLQNYSWSSRANARGCNSSINDGNEHKVVFTKGSSDTVTSIKLYIDGNECSNYNNIADTMIGNPQPTSTLTIGVRHGSSGSNNNWFSGEIREVALWDVELSSAEAILLTSSNIKRLPLQIQPDNLLVYFPLDDEEDGSSCDGDTFKDYGTKEDNGTGSDGGNNSGLTATAENILSYP